VGGAEGDDGAVGQLFKPAAGLVVGQGPQAAAGQGLPPGARRRAELEPDARQVDAVDLDAARPGLGVQQARRAGGLIEQLARLLVGQCVFDLVKPGRFEPARLEKEPPLSLPAGPQWAPRSLQAWPAQRP